MASVYLHSRGNSRYYVAVFMGAEGRQLHRSTKETDRARAISVAEKWERKARILRKAKGLQNQGLILESFISAAQSAARGEFTETSAREVLNRILEASGQSPLRLDSSREFLESWVESKRKAKAEGTAKRYGKTVREFLLHLGAKADKALSAVTPKDVESFRDRQVELGKTESSANMEVKTLSIAFNHARRQGILLTNPAEAVERLDGQSQVRSPFSLEQVGRILARADREWRGLILVGLCTGLRIGTASRLQWKNIDLERQTVVVASGKRIRGKPSRVLENVLLPDLNNYLRAVSASDRSPEAYLFPTLSKLRPGGCRGLSQIFQEIMHAAGVFANADQRRVHGMGRRFNDLTFHSLRHTYVSFMANHGVNKEIRKKLAGHTTDVHDRYTHLELGTLREALKHFPSIGEGSMS